MARILCVADGMTSVIFSVLELARRLAADGHSVTFLAPEAHRELVAAQGGPGGEAGLAFAALPPSGYESFLRADARRGLVRRLASLRERRSEALDSLGMDGFVRRLAETEPDLVLVLGEMHEHVVVAAGAGVRTVLLNTFCSIWRRRGLPPPHVDARPGVGWRGSSAGMALHWTALRVRKALRAARLRVARVGCDRVSLLHRLARRHGFDLEAEADAGQWLIPFTYRSLPALSLHAREFEFPHEPPARVRYVGPMVLRQRADPLSTEEQTRLDGIFERAGEGSRKLIVASFGSAFTAQPDLPRRLAEAVRGRPWELVLGLGRGGDPEALGAVPANVHLFRWLPQLEVLRRADAAVTHGGIQTLDECVLHGVPALIFCGGETDMAGSTARWVHHGLGLAGSRDPEPAQIGRQLEALLSESAFRDAVDRFRERYEAYETERVAERVVRELLDVTP